MNKEEKRFWIFTFNNGTAQKIYADSYIAARIAMCEAHGLKWSFQYSQKEWKELKDNKNRIYTMEHILDNVIHAEI